MKLDKRTTEFFKSDFGRILKNAAFFAAAVLLVLLVWVIAYASIKNDYVLPSVKDVFKSGFALFGQKSFYIAFFSTLWRVVRAFLISFLPAAGFAVLSYLFPPFSKIVTPIISGIRSFPTMALMLVLLVWSTPDKAPIILAFLALFPLLYTGMKAALDGVDDKLVQMGKVYRIPLSKKIAYMYLPVAAPYVLKESAGALSFAVKLVVSAEIMAYTYQSLGGLLQDANVYSKTAELFAVTLLVVLTGVLLEGLGTLLANAVKRRLQ